MSDQIAVMDRGQIVEIGTPRDIYLRPKSQFAASFIGLANVIPGEKMGDQVGGKWLIKIPFGEIRCIADDPDWHRGILVLVRPEGVKLSRTPPGEFPNVWAGEVKEKTFLGDFVDCQVSVNGFLLRARLDPYSEVTEGDKVYIHIDPTRCTAIAAGKSSRQYRE
jgi:iron(III) transport system ATP-binding protein